MKNFKYIMLILSNLLLFLFCAKGQTTTLTLDSPQSSVQNNYASQWVKLSNGYSYTPNANNSNYMKAYIYGGSNTIINTPYNPLNTDADITNKSINTALNVGTVAGSHTVSLTGGASYSIPINVAPGTGGMIPSLSLVYDSQAGNGLLGMGWNLSGLSAISRVGKDIYHDTENAPITLTESDALALDGNRLIPNSTTYCASGCVYSTESESFSRITSSGSGVTSWFKVETKDGKTLEYGNGGGNISKVYNTEGTAVVYWALNKITDSFGNYIEFRYTIPAGVGNELVLDEILYTGNANAGLAPYNKVKFSYGVREDINTVYIAGTPLVNKHLLTKITTYAENALVSEYSFKYGKNGLYSYLTELSQAGAGGTALNATIFKYGDEATGFTTASSGVVDGDNYDVFSGDFNGDGYTDVVRANRVTGTTYHNSLSFFKNNEGTFVTTPITVSVNNYSSIISGPVGNQYTSKYTDYLVTDIDGDSKDDVILAERALGYNSLTMIRSYHTNSTFSLVSNDNSYAMGTVNGDKYFDDINKHLFLGDFDGDSRMDYITILKNTAGTYYTRISFPKQGLGIFNQIIGSTSPTTTLPSNWQTADYINVMDFDGDGKQDILVMKGSNCEIFSIVKSGTSFVAKQVYYSATFPGTTVDGLYFADFNGDRKTDILRKSSLDASYSIGYSTGKIFAPTPFSFYSTGNSNEKMQIGDYNGDGASDILQVYDVYGKDWNSSANLPPLVYQNTKVNLYYFSGDYFNYVQHTTTNQSLPGLLLGDFNGDGRQDVMPRYGNTLGTSNIWTFKPKGKERLLEKIADGYKNVTQFDYKNLTEGTAVYSQSLTNFYPLSTVRLPLQVVSAVKTPDGLNGTTITNYTYEDAVIHKQGRGFLGFKKRHEMALGYKNTTELEFNTTFYVSLLKSQTSSVISNNFVISEATYTNTLVSLGNKRYFQKVDNVLEKDYLNATQTNTATTYDSANGNITASTSNVNNGLQVTIVSNSNYCTCGSWLAVVPQTTTVTTTRNGQPSVTKQTTYTFTAQGAPLTQIDFANKPTKAVTTTYSNHNSFGAPLTTTVSATGLTNRAASVVFDTKGRFVLQKTNPLGQISSAVYSAKWGKPLTETGIDGLVTSYEYDDFGRIFKVNMPQGYTISTTYGWDVKTTGNGTNTSDVDNSIYYVQTSHPGKPDAKTWYDALGRERKMTTEGFNGQTLQKVTTYNARGKVQTKTNPFYSSQSPILTTMTYDVLDRISTVNNGLTTVTSTYTPNAPGSTNSVLKIDVSTTAPGVAATSKSIDGTGKTVSTNDGVATATMLYDSWGNPKSTTIGTTEVVSMTYDDYGRQTALVDKNAGTTTYEYNAFGELKTQVDAKNNTHTMDYDVLGRIKTRIGPEGTTTYNYKTSGNGINQIESVTGFTSGVSTTYTYDAFSRVTQTSDVIDVTTFNKSFTYDTYNNVKTVTYPSGLVITRNYDANSYLTNIKNGNTALFTATAINNYGNYTAYTLGNGAISTLGYDTYGFPTTFTAGASNSLQNLSFSFNQLTGNLSSRTDYRKGKTESFGYDNINRLRTMQVTGGTAYGTNYDNIGNITFKAEAGNYVYDATKIHAVANVTNPSSTISAMTQNVTYTPYHQPQTITENGYELTYTYAADYERIKGVLKQTVGSTTSTLNTRYYFGDFERNIANGVTTDVHYIGGDGVNCIVVKPSTQTTFDFYYVYKDYLGSILTVTNSAGGVVFEQNFDAWGRNRNATDWTYNVTATAPTWLYRGYTGHEHLPQFGLINMNGRLYDPILGRMLSPDNYVHEGAGAQGYNRYAYALNNPLKYTDPDGNFPIVSTIIGAALGVVTNGINNLSHGQGFFKGWGKAALFGAIGGAISGGIGSYATALANGGAKAFEIAATQAFLHGASGAALSIAQGGGFGSGFLSGAISSVVGSSVGGNPLAQILGGGLSGGIGSVLAGGSFWDGVRQGLITGGLNHAAHSGAFGSGLAAALKTQKLRHIFSPDATSIDISFLLGAGVSFEEGITRIKMLAGPDKGKFFDAFTSKMGIGLGVGPSVGGTDYYFDGNINTFSYENNISGQSWYAGSIPFLGASVTGYKSGAKNGTTYAVSISWGAKSLMTYNFWGAAYTNKDRPLQAVTEFNTYMSSGEWIKLFNK